MDAAERTQYQLKCKQLIELFTHVCSTNECTLEEYCDLKINCLDLSSGICYSPLDERKEPFKSDSFGWLALLKALMSDRKDIRNVNNDLIGIAHLRPNPLNSYAMLESLFNRCCYSRWASVDLPQQIKALADEAMQWAIVQDKSDKSDKSKPHGVSILAMYYWTFIKRQRIDCLDLLLLLSEKLGFAEAKTTFDKLMEMTSPGASYFDQHRLMWNCLDTQDLRQWKSDRNFKNAQREIAELKQRIEQLKAVKSIDTDGLMASDVRSIVGEYI